MQETRTYKLTKNARKRSTMAIATDLVDQLHGIDTEVTTHGNIVNVAWQDESTETYYEVSFGRYNAVVDIDSKMLMSIEVFPYVRRLLARAQF